VGGLALKALQNRASGSDDSADRELRASSSSSAPQDVDEECKWLHNLLNILWPRINKFLQVMVQEQIIPEIDRALPKMLKGSVTFPKIYLGRAVPSFRNIRLKEQNDQAIVLQVSIEMASDMDVEIQALRVPIGMKRLQFSGELNVVFHPEKSAPPFFGGVTVFFIDPPRLDMDFTGAADFVDMPVLRNVVRSTILHAVSGAVVLPARIAVDLNEDDDTDQADLSFPPPVGILRILVRKGTDLVAADFGMRPSSDPFVVIEVGQQRWQSSVVEKSLNPVWEHGNVQDFLVYDRGQKMNIFVYDKDTYSRDDLIGSVSRIDLEPFMLRKPCDTDFSLNLEGRPAGTLQISSRWFELSPSAPPDIPAAVARGPSQLVLAVKLLGITDLPKSYKPPFVVQVEVSTVNAVLTSRKSLPPSNIKPVAVEVADIARRLHRAHTPINQISEVTGLELRAVSLAIAQDSPQSYARAKKEAVAELSATHPAFNQILRLPLPWTSEVVNSATVSLSLSDRTDRRLAKAVVVRLADVAAAEVEGGFALSCGGTLQAKLSIAWMALPN